MLLDRGFKSGDIVSIKLTTGEELIGSYIEKQETTYKISKPLRLAPMPQGMGFAPFMFTIDPEQSVSLDESHVVFICLTQNEMSKEYIRNTTSIQL